MTVSFENRDKKLNVYGSWELRAKEGSSGRKMVKRSSSVFHGGSESRKNHIVSISMHKLQLEREPTRIVTA